LQIAELQIAELQIAELQIADFRLQNCRTDSPKAPGFYGSKICNLKSAI